MDRKKSLVTLALLLALAPFGFSQTTTVGGKKSNTSIVQTWPANGNTLSCTEVAITTYSVTNIISSNNNRMWLKVQNVSISTSDATQQRPAMVAITTLASTAIPSNQAGFLTINGWILPSCLGGYYQDYSDPVGASCVFDMSQGGTIYSGSLYAIAESLGLSVAVNAKVEVCELAP